MNITTILEKYRKVSGGLEKDCQFISNQIRELVKELRVKPFDHQKLNEYSNGYEDCLRETNKKLDEILK